MEAFRTSLLAICLLALVGCSKSETTPQVDNRFHIQGSWALYEIKQTTPSGTQVKQISTGGPVQGLTFLPSGRLAKQGDDLSAFANWAYYQVDSTQAGLRWVGLAGHS